MRHADVQPQEGSILCISTYTRINRAYLGHHNTAELLRCQVWNKAQTHTAGGMPKHVYCWQVVVQPACQLVAMVGVGSIAVPNKHRSPCNR